MKTGALKFLSMLAIACFVSVTACKDEDAISYSSDDNANLQSEASMDAQLEDVSDMATVAMVADAGTMTGSRSDGFTGAREIQAANLDARLACATVTLEFATDNNPSNPSGIHGYVYVDFGDGCTGPGGRVRKGRIVIEFIGRRYIPGSTVIITTEDYSVDGIAVEATRTEVNATGSEESAPKFTISEEITLTFQDGTTATRTSTRGRVWNRMQNPLEDTWTITGSAFGSTRRGVEYVMTITNALVFKRSCVVDTKSVIPVQGTKELVVNGKKITTDFGDGTCDTTVTITVNGRSKDITISASGD